MEYLDINEVNKRINGVFLFGVIVGLALNYNSIVPCIVGAGACYTISQFPHILF